nr:hypothetical protein [Geomonas nitrogeniifigens]
MAAGLSQDQAVRVTAECGITESHLSLLMQGFPDFPDRPPVVERLYDVGTQSQENGPVLFFIGENRLFIDCPGRYAFRESFHLPAHPILPIGICRYLIATLSPLQQPRYRFVTATLTLLYRGIEILQPILQNFVKI